MADQDEILRNIDAGVYQLRVKKGKSAVWSLFAEVTKDDGNQLDGFVYCRTCKHLLKFNGKQTSNLIRHICFSATAEEMVPKREMQMLKRKRIQTEIELKRKRIQDEIERNKLPTRAVECPENSKKSRDEASALSCSWEALYRNLESKQQLFANKVIMEALYQAALGRLHENSYKALESNSQPQRQMPSFSTYTLPSNSTPPPRPPMIASTPREGMPTEATPVSYEYECADLLNDVKYE